MPPTPTQITVRRSLLPAAATQPAAPNGSADPGLGDTTGAEASPSEKSPRVFRVAVLQAVLSEPTAATAEAAWQARPCQGASADAPLLTRGRGLAAAKRPGPVLHVVNSALKCGGVELDAAGERGQRQLSPPQTRAPKRVRMAAAVGAKTSAHKSPQGSAQGSEPWPPAMLAEHPAQPFVIVDTRFAAAWQQLAQRVDALRAELDARLR